MSSVDMRSIAAWRPERLLHIMITASHCRVLKAFMYVYLKNEHSAIHLSDAELCSKLVPLAAIL